MSLSKLAEKCRKCPRVDTCDHKRMEAVGILLGELTLEQHMTISSIASHLPMATMAALSPIPNMQVTTSIRRGDWDKLKDQLYRRMGIPEEYITSRTIVRMEE